jgi:hypothetical protein
VLTFQSHGLSSASGFFFEREDRLFLVTSRHVLFDAPSGHTPTASRSRSTPTRKT